MIDVIPLNRDLRLMLLRWLKSGIDTKELCALYDQYCSVSNMTDAELDAELERITKLQHREMCERIKKLNLCPYA